MVTIEGKPLYQVVWDKLEPETDDIFLQVREDKKYSRPSRVDLLDVESPLEGIYSALVNAREDWIFISACDLPLIEPEIVDELSRRTSHHTQVVIPGWNSGYYEPLVALYHSSLTPKIKRALEDGVRKITDFLEIVDGVRTASIEDMVDSGKVSESCFFNVNTTKDLEKLGTR